MNEVVLSATECLIGSKVNVNLTPGQILWMIQEHGFSLLSVSPWSYRRKRKMWYPPEKHDILVSTVVHAYIYVPYMQNVCPLCVNRTVWAVI